jgi:two-component system, NtrC family, sensor kinase
MKTRRKTTTKVKRPKAPTAARRRGPTAADLRKQLEQARKRLAEALAQQTATSELLSVISSSPGQLQPVIDFLAKNAAHLCDAKFGLLVLRSGDDFYNATLQSFPSNYAATPGAIRLPAHPDSALRRMVRTNQRVHIADLKTEPRYRDGDPATVGIVDRGGARTFLLVPLLRERELVGGLAIFRQEVRPFSDTQIALLESFAKQAVIAIENTRLLNELRQRTDDLSEALEQQTATSEVLQVISSSPGELEPVFQAMLENATRLCEAKFGNLFLREGDSALRIAAMYGETEYLEFWQRAQLFSLRENADTPLARAVETKAVVHVSDLRTDPAFAAGNRRVAALLEAAGARSTLVVPMVTESELMGTITIYRQEVRPFTDKQIELVKNFAAQAVIAIENTRLLNELRQRTDDLSESLEQQTATSEVLQVISSSPGELRPVFEAMLENATRICAAQLGNLLLYDGNLFRVEAIHGAPSAWEEFRRRDPIIRWGPKNPLRRLAASKQLLHIADAREEEAHIRACVQLSRMIAATNWTAARKFRASLSYTRFTS